MTITLASATFYARQDGTNAVRRLTAAQTARLVCDTSGTIYADPTGAIAGHVFVSPASDGQVYSLAYDRWYDPSLYPTLDAADAFFAAQPDAGPVHTEAPQWWTDPSDPPVAVATEAPGAAPEPSVVAESPVAAPTPDVPGAAPSEGATANGNRLHALLDAVTAKLAAADHALVHEAQAILRELGL